MVDREKVETILSRRFPGAGPHQVAAAANAIMGLGDEWEEVDGHESAPRWRAAVPCRGFCYLARELNPCLEFRLFRRREM